MNVMDTSLEAYRTILPEAGDLRGQCLDVLKRHGPSTADQIAEELGRSVLAIRPRVSELNKAGDIVDTGRRGTNRSGRPAKVWALAGCLK